MKLSQLLFSGEYISRSRAEDIEFSFITHELERLSAGCLFVCLRGVSTDTHYLAARIAAARPAAVIVEREEEFACYPELAVFTVDSSRLTLARLWSRFWGEPQKQLRMVGITGTNGKTSTAHLLAGILNRCGHRAAVIGTVGCELDGIPLEADGDAPGAYRARTMTTPDPDALYRYLKRSVELGADIAIMEVSSHSLALSKVEPIRFEVAIFTNFSPEHLDFHRTMEDYLAAKAKLFSMCDVGVFNADDRAGECLMSLGTCEGVTFGALWDGDMRAEEITPLGEAGSEYTFVSSCEETRVTVSIPGMTSVYNSLAAITAALALGIPQDKACEAIKHIGSVEGRLEVIAHKLDGVFTVIIDYAHTEAALTSLLRTARKLVKEDGRLIIVFGCGGDRDPSKRAPMGASAQALADLAIVTSDNPRTEEPMRIILDILRGMPERRRRRVMIDRRDAIGYAISIARRNDVILLAGKGHERYELINNERLPFDEREIVRAAVEERLKKQN